MGPRAWGPMGPHAPPRGPMDPRAAPGCSWRDPGPRALSAGPRPVWDGSPKEVQIFCITHFPVVGLVGRP